MNIKKQLSRQFEMKDLVAPIQIVGMRSVRGKVQGSMQLL